MKYNKIIIYGGTSEISLALIDMYINECEKLIVFCRSKKKFFGLQKDVANSNLENLKIQLFEVELNDLVKNLEIIDKMKNDISGVIWVAGYTGDGNEENFVYALITILGSTFYCIGGLLTLKLRNKKNENVTTSTTIWSVIFLLPFSLIFETPWNSSPTLVSTLSLLYLGVIATGLAWLIRFRILTVNGLVFQTQVAYLIPIFGIIFGYFLMDEIITWRVIVSLAIILIGIYIFKKNNKGLKN